VQITDSDERDSTWEQWESTFRVYFTDTTTSATRTIDLTDATFGEVHLWAEQSAAPAEVIAIALVGFDARGLRGLTWLVGMDPNDLADTALQGRMLREMAVARDRRQHRE